MDVNCKLEQEQEQERLPSQAYASEQEHEQEQERLPSQAYASEQEPEQEQEDTQSKGSEEQNTINFTSFLKERGLYCEELKFVLPSKKQQIKSKVLFNYVEEEIDKIPNTMSQKKREKILQELQEEEEYNKISVEKQREKHEKIEKLRKLREEIKLKHDFFKTRTREQRINN